MAMEDKERMQIRLSKTNKDRLNHMADRWGMSANSLVSYIIGQWLDNNYDLKEVMREKMFEQMMNQGKMIQEQILSNPAELAKYQEIFAMMGQVSDEVVDHVKKND